MFKLLSLVVQNGDSSTSTLYVFLWRAYLVECAHNIPITQQTPVFWNKAEFILERKAFFHFFVACAFPSFESISV